MENKCSKCGGELVPGCLRTPGGPSGNVHGFSTSKKRIFWKYSDILELICDACVQCGSIENIRVKYPEEIKKN